jgi:hypothetical protein
MKKTLIVVLLIACVAAAFAGYAFLHTPQTPPTSTEITTPVVVEGVGMSADKKPDSGTASLFELRMKKSDLECQIAYEPQNGEVIKGTFFTSNGTSRGDFIVPAPEYGGTILSSVIMSDDMIYVWSRIADGVFGFKSTIKDGRATELGTKEPIPQEEIVRYTCVDWAVDGSVFVPPAYVDFKDASSLIKQGMEDGLLAE